MESHSHGCCDIVSGCAEVGSFAAMRDFEMNVRGEVGAKPAADVGDGDEAAVVEVGDDGGGDIPLLSAGEFAEAGFAGIEEGVVLASGEWRD